jgi:alanine-glyoxylate transaminase/serine-glyoxylate transaminase/serine-pyruvate transaminase
LELYASREEERSYSLTAVLVPETVDADVVRELARARYDLTLGGGLDRLKGSIFRIGHLGDFNDLMLCATLAGVELALAGAGVSYRPGGVQAALTSLAAGATP